VRWAAFCVVPQQRMPEMYAGKLKEVPRYTKKEILTLYQDEYMH
jgi:hypothetical protein